MLVTLFVIGSIMFVAGLLIIALRSEPTYERHGCVSTRTNSNGWRHVTRWD